MLTAKNKMSQPIIPPFTEETANLKVKNAQNLWNTKDPYKVVNAYTKDSMYVSFSFFFEFAMFLIRKIDH